mmetsp:Transcript_24486/g.28024  ORF Transcript_24486/g.28024 Transcript_24486/m.28024 type:complete len:449 (-) Transcript_24486:62-1408(-)
MSSENFFGRPFEPVNGNLNKRSNARSSTSNGNGSSGVSGGYYANNRTSAPSNANANVNVNARPTVTASSSYYPTATTTTTAGNNNNASSASPFLPYQGYTNTSTAPSYYDTNTNQQRQSQHDQQQQQQGTTDASEDWFTGSSTGVGTGAGTASNSTAAASPFMMPNTSTASHSNSNDNDNMHQPPPPHPYQPQPSTNPATKPSNVKKSDSMEEYLSGTMDNNANNGLSGPFTMMQPTPTTSNNQNNTSNNKSKFNSSSSLHGYVYNPDDFADEPPLLEELGINISHIQTKSLAVILPVKYAKQAIDTKLMEDSDMAGPIVFAVLLAIELLLTGSFQFGYIYGFGLFGCLTTTLIINLMSPTDAISVWTVVSILGYSLLPVNLLAAINVFYRIRLMGDIGILLGMITIVWCTVSSTRLFERGCGLRDQRYLIGYPNALLYSAFVLLTIF